MRGWTPGWIQVDVAAALGRPQSYVAKCEGGKRRVDVVELEAFGKVYRRPLLFFLPTAGENRSSSPERKRPRRA